MLWTQELLKSEVPFLQFLKGKRFLLYLCRTLPSISKINSELNFCRKTTVYKSAWIKACQWYIHFYKYMSTVGSLSPLEIVPLINKPLIFQKRPLLNNCTFQEKEMNRIFKILKKKNKFCVYFLLRLSSSQVFSNKVSSTLKIHERPLTKGFLLTSCRSRLQL